MKRSAAWNLILFAVVLSACARTPVGTSGQANLEAPQGGELPAGIDPFAPTGGLTRVDTQGAIVVEITPLNLDTRSSQLEFEVALNTHSVDLSMDIAMIATLQTETGTTVPATLWEAERGGHHVTGKLIFPAATADGKPLVEGASKLILTIAGLDAPSRSFEWDIK